MGDCGQCVIRNRAICSSLNAEELALLGRKSHKQLVRRGQTLAWEGSEAMVVANVITGVLKLSLSTSDGREQIVGVVFASDFIGRPFGTESPYSVTALTDAEMCVFPRAAFDEFAREHPHLEHKLLQRTLIELDEARAWMMLLGKKTAEERIATLLLRISERIRTNGCAAPLTDLDEFDLPMDRQQMADILGLTIETVSRQLTRIKNCGVIALPDRRRVIINDRQALIYLAEAA